MSAAIVAHLLALAQTLLVAQVALGLLLLSDHRRAADKLHYAYGSLSLAAILAPWMYAPAEGRTAAALVRRHFLPRRGARRASIHDRIMKRFFTDMNSTLRGFLIIALIAAVVVVLSLQSVLATVGGLLQIGFFLAIAFFLFLLWREKRGDIESWQDRSRNVFYAAIVLAVVDVGAFIGLGPSGPDALAFFLVLGACAYAIFRVWRSEHTYS